MAGGKETPRQKMIGMMYLVLTALLALQVSSAVLEKFAIVNVTLEDLKNEGDRKNALVLGSIVEAGSKKTNPKVVAAVANAQKVREATTKTIKSIEDLKLRMLELSHTNVVNGKFINDHGSQVAAMMMDPRVPHGKAFEKALNDYVKEISDLSGEKFGPLARAPKDIPFFADDPDHNKKDFLTFTFENTPPIAALASVTQIQTEVLAYEGKALDILAKQADAGTVKFSTIVPMVKPKASIVAAGDKYEAQLFVAAAAEGVTPTMFRNGQALPVAPDPETKILMGKIEFLASASNYDANGQSKQTFKTEIKGYGDSTYTRTIEYIVAKPVIRVTTGNAPTLYMNCGNTVNIEVPALGTNYNPSFTGEGADIVKGEKVGKVTIIPKQRKVFVTVTNGGAVLGKEPFDVKPIPKPRYVPRDNSGKEIDLKTGVKGASLTGLRISADAEENFKTEVPKDATYRIRSMEVFLARGTARVLTINATSELPDISSWRSQFKPGDRIVVDIKKVTRRTFQGEEENVDIVGGILQIPIQ